MCVEALFHIYIFFINHRFVTSKITMNFIWQLRKLNSFSGDHQLIFFPFVFCFVFLLVPTSFIAFEMRFTVLYCCRIVLTSTWCISVTIKTDLEALAFQELTCTLFWSFFSITLQPSVWFYKGETGSMILSYVCCCTLRRRQMTTLAARITSQSSVCSAVRSD